jgi:thiopurine S-methyltransferase
MLAMWQERWRTNKTGWDLKGPHPLLDRILDLAADSTGGKLHGDWLIPGCGRAHDAQMIVARGAACAIGKDLVPEAIHEASKLYGKIPGVFFECGDVCEISEPDVGRFAGVFDRAMLCALGESMRRRYVEAVALALKKGGVFASIAFAKTSEPSVGPPFSMSESELKHLFSQSFQIINLEETVSGACDEKILSEWIFVAVKI